MSSSLEPKTFTATGSRTPVESISIRLAIGWVKLLPQPGICKAVLISSTRSVFVFFQSRSRSANGLSSAARRAVNSSGAASRAASLRSRPSFVSSSRAAQLAAPTARSKSSQLSDFIRSLSRRVVLGVEVLGDPGEQGRLGEAEHVAGGLGGPLQRRRRRREQVGAIAEHAQLDQPLGGVVDQLGHVIGQDLDGKPIAVGLRQRLDQRLALGRRRLAGDGGGLDAAEQGVDRLADQGAAQLRAELRQPPHRQVAEHLIDLARRRSSPLR